MPPVIAMPAAPNGLHGIVEIGAGDLHLGR
jgi:hypothetical protein